MLLYHGTTLIIQQPLIIKGDIGRDFGFAFYTTDIEEQAKRWAIRRAKLQSRKENRIIKPFVNIYEWDKNCADLSVKEFKDTSLDWLELVVNCRSNVNFKHNFDIVCGKIANDNVGETVLYVLNGIMRKEDAIERLKFEKINNQIAFCSEKSLKTLKYLNSYELEVWRWVTQLLEEWLFQK